MNAEDPLFILYTSGSTGKPKGVLHTTGGYLVYAAMTHQYVFDYHDGDIYWCTADVGWVTGHSYIVYGPLANGATTLMFEGVPNYPDDVALLGGHRQAQGQHLLHRADRDPRADAGGRRAGEEDLARSRCACSASVGEPINPEAWEWYYRVVGDEPLPDRRHLVADRDRRHPDHAAARRDRAEARLGDAAVLRRQPADRRRRGQGARRRRRAAISCIADSWPGQMRTVYGDHQRFVETYFTTYPGQVLHRRRLPPRRGRLLLDHRPRRRRDQRRPATAWAPPKSRARWSRIRRSRRPPSSAIRTTSRARASTPTSR